MVIRGQSQPVNSSAPHSGLTGPYKLCPTSLESTLDQPLMGASMTASQPLEGSKLNRPLSSPQPPAPSRRLARPGIMFGQSEESEGISADFTLTGVGNSEVAPLEESPKPEDTIQKPLPPSLGRPPQHESETQPSPKVLLGLVAGRPLKGASTGKVSLSARPMPRVAAAVASKRAKEKDHDKIG